MAESFFATLECELLNRRSFKSETEARTALFTYIEGWHNPRRRHSALGYHSPAQFERLQHGCNTTGRSPEHQVRLESQADRCSRKRDKTTWVNADGPKAVSFAQLGQIFVGAVGQFCIGGNTCEFAPTPAAQRRR